MIAAAVLSGCASLLRGRTQAVKIEAPPGSIVEVDGRPLAGATTVRMIRTRNHEVAVETGRACATWRVESRAGDLVALGVIGETLLAPVLAGLAISAVPGAWNGGHTLPPLGAIVVVLAVPVGLTIALDDLKRGGWDSLAPRAIGAAPGGTWTPRPDTAFLLNSSD